MVSEKIDALSHEDFDLLILAIGIAVGTCYRDNNPALARSLFRLANTLNIGNPNWIPYQTETEAHQ